MTTAIETVPAKRTAMKIEEQGQEIYVLDTGQIFVYTAIPSDHPSMAHRRNPDNIKEYPLKISFDTRTGASGYDIKGYQAAYGWGMPTGEFFEQSKEILRSHGLDLGTWNVSYESHADPARYPELQSFIGHIDELYAKRVPTLMEPPAYGFFSVLLGQEEVPRYEVLKPHNIYWYFRSYIFPMIRVDAFDLAKGKAELIRTGKFLTAEDARRQEGMVAHIKPSSISNQKKSVHTSIEMHIYNAANLQKFLDGDFRPAGIVPSQDDSIFHMSYGVESGRKWLIFDSMKFDHEFIHREGLDATGQHDSYVKIDAGLAAIVERIAPIHL
jgi:hypothetical protein